MLEGSPAASRREPWRRAARCSALAIGAWGVLTHAGCSRSRPEAPPELDGRPALEIAPSHGASVQPVASVSNRAGDVGPTSPESGASLPSLTGAWLERFDAPGGSSVFVAPPLGARSARPVIVGVHGAGDRPEWSCGGWRLAAGARAFVVCPQGTAVAGNRFAWSSERQLVERVAHALAVLRERYGAYVAAGPAMYAGFSQGATLARGALLAEPGRFSTAVFAEGGYETIVDRRFATSFKAAGGARVLIVCGGPACFQRARSAERILTAAGLAVSTAGDPAAGHNLNARMQQALRAEWPALVRGDAAWANL